MTFLNHRSLSELQKEAFLTTEPCPWFVHENPLCSEGYSRLRDGFPSEDVFEQHIDLPRPHNQRPHNRLYLAYRQSIYHGIVPQRRGILDECQLSPDWLNFIQELESGFYFDWSRSILNKGDMNVRFAWHRGTYGSEISPHIDSDKKIATHIFYFNDQNDWNERWGGETLILGGKRGSKLNPEFEDFDQIIATCPCIGNRALLFANSRHSWHGVRKLNCPKHAQRRIFTVVFETPSP